MRIVLKIFAPGLPGLMILVFAQMSGYAQDNISIPGLSEHKKESVFDEAFKQCNFEHVDSALMCAHDLLELGQKLKYPEGVITAYRELGYAYTTQSKPDSARYFLHQGLGLAKKTRDSLQIANIYEVMARTFRKEMNADSMRFYLEKADRIGRQIKSDDVLAGVYIEYANYYSNTSQNDSALINYMQAREFFEQEGDSLNIAVSHANIGKIYVTEGDYEKALDVLRKSNKILRSTGNLSFIPNNLNNMGVVYDRTGQFDSARNAYQKAHDIKKSLGNEASLAISFFNLGSLAISMGDFEEARQYMDSSMHICEKLSIEPGFAYNYSGLGELYLMEGKYDLAIEYLNKGIEKARKFNLNDVLQENLHNLSVVYREKGNYKKAYENQYLYYQIRDSIRSVGAEKTINVLQARFDSEQKENKILQQQMALKEKEVAIQQSKLEKERLSYFLIVGLIILVFVLIFSLRTRRHLKKVKEQADTINRKNEQLAELTEFRNSMISTMVHDLKTPLNTIIGFSDLPPDKENLQYIHQIGYGMLHLVSNILDVQYQKEAKLQLHLQELLPQTVLDEALPEVKTEMQMKEQDIVVSLPEVRVLADHHLLKRVFVNLLSNAVKFSPENGQISLQGEILPDKGMLKINVRDQGGGIDTEILDKVFEQFAQSKQAKFGMSYSSGIGLYFCKIAVEEMGGEIGLTNEDTGLNAWFLLPLAAEAENPPLSQ